ncbi:MAG: ATP-binding protein [Cyanobacteria bacterium P01_E01_bin.6]
MTLELIPYLSADLKSCELNQATLFHGGFILRQLFEKSVDATLIWHDRCLVACNKVAVDLFGYTDADMLQSSYRKLSPSLQANGESSHEQTVVMLETAAQSGCHRFEWCYQKADLTLFFVEVTLSAIAIDENSTLFYEVCRPIHNRQRQEKPQQESNQLLQKILDTIPQAIFWKDRQSVYLGCNQNFAHAAGLEDPSKIIGLTDYDLPWTTEEADLYRQHDQLVMTSKTAQYHLMESQQHADGSHIWCDTNKIPLYDAEGHVIGVMGTFEDVTQRQQYEEALKQKARDLEQFVEELQQKQSKLIQTEKMSGLGQLVAGVAHEINNPVNFIHGNLTYARNYIQDLLAVVKAYREYYPESRTEIDDLIEDVDLDFLLRDLPKLLDSMQVGAHRIHDIVASLRTFSRVDQAEVKDVDIHTGLNSTLMILQGRIKATPDRPEIQLHKQYGTLPRVKCYAGQLNQVFMNILVNAIDALDERDCHRSLDDMKANPSQLWITTQVIGDRDAVQISIRDNGLGIPESIQRRMFDPFFTTKPVGKGTGLGMSISYQIVVEKHNGTLTCHSTLGQGTEFIIEIPVTLA